MTMYFQIVKADHSQISGRCDRVKFFLAHIDVFDIDGYIIVSVPISEILSFKVE